MPTNVVVVVVESLQPSNHIDQPVDICSSYKVFKFVKKGFIFIVPWQVCAVVGGMAMEKQERLLSRHPSIVVATPGRLWSLMSEVSASWLIMALPPKSLNNTM